MEEKVKNPSDLREYEAIPHGGRKLATGIIAVLTILAMMGVVSYVGIWLDGQGARVSSMICALIAVGGFVVAVYFSAHQATLDWLKRYWSRNVRGYVVVHYPEGGQAKCSDPFPRWHERPIDVFLNSYPFVVLWPLGGWFKHSLAFWRAKQSWWSVARDTRFSDTPVRVTDNNGSSLRFTAIEDAMSFIAQRLEREAKPFLNNSSDMPFSWLRVLEGLSEQRDDARRDRELDRREHTQNMDTLFRAIDAATGQAAPPVHGSLDWLVEQVRRLIAERNAARGEVDRYQNGFLPAAVKDCDAARKERDAAVHFVNDLDIALQESHRLRTAIEGLRLRLRILEWLKQHDPRWTEEGPESLAPILAAVRAELADKQKRDRRRHGKKADPAPASAA